MLMETTDPFLKTRLFCPGPTPVPAEAKQVAAEANIYHRTEQFYREFQRCRELLGKLIGAKRRPCILTCSGTGAMEAAVTNLTSAGDTVLTINAGKFGERWAKMTNAYGCDVRTLALPWGEPCSPEQVSEALRRERPKALFFQANETSTGTYFPVKEICKKIRSEFDGLIIVDAISSLCAHPMDMDAWGIDAVVAGSQKGFGIPPGLAFIALSERAWGRITSRPRFYFDLPREEKNQTEGQTAWTPASSLVQALKVNLEYMDQIGFDNIIAHHANCAAAVRSAAEALDLKLLSPKSPSQAVTALLVPQAVDGKKLTKILASKYKTVFAGGQDALAGKIIRFSHLGFVDRFDVLTGIAALEFALADLGYKSRLGEGVKAALKKMS